MEMSIGQASSFKYLEMHRSTLITDILHHATYIQLFFNSLGGGHTTHTHTHAKAILRNWACGWYKPVQI